MAEYLSVPTVLKARFRKARDAQSARCLPVRKASGTSPLSEDALAASRLSSELVRFLIEMDRKLDAILGYLERETLTDDFPLEGTVVELGGSGLVLESKEPLAPGQSIELLLVLEALPLRMVSLVARVEEILPDFITEEGPGAVYQLGFVFLDAEDREIVIQYVFQEERRRIRMRKGEEE